MFSQTSGGMPTGLHRPSGQASSEKAGNGLSVWTGPKTWPGIRKSNDLWPMSEPCCDRFHSSSPTLPTNKCPAESHRSSRGCFLAVPSRVSEAQCLEAPGGGETSAVPCPGIWKCHPLCGFCGGVWGSSWPWWQDLNRWPNGHPRRSLLVPSSCHICFIPRLWLPGDCFLRVLHSRHHGYTIPVVKNRLPHTNQHWNLLEALHPHMWSTPKPRLDIIVSA